MWAKGLILKHEYEKQLVPEEKIQLFIKGIEFLDKGTIKSEIKVREDLYEQTQKNKYLKEIDKIKSIKIEEKIVMKNTIDFSGAKSQKEAVKFHLERLTTITSVEAITEYGCTRLADTVYRLKKEGMQIKTNKITKNNRWGNPVTFAKYEFTGYKKEAGTS